MPQYDLTSIGAGNMAEGIIAAVVKQRLYAPDRILVADPVAERRDLFETAFNVRTTDDNRDAVAQATRVLLAVKPQSFDEVAAAIAPAVTDDHLLISIMAGVATSRIEAAFLNAQPRVVRVMPNLPIRVGAGIAGLCAGARATPDDVAAARALFDAGGSTIVLDDEALMDAVTAVAGSGPAYFYYFVEAIVAGGTASGLTEADALKLAEHTCLGAARMMLETKLPPAELRRRVTSQGGTTQAALEHMDRAAVPDAIRDAVQAAFNRGQELGS